MMDSNGVVSLLTKHRAKREDVFGMENDFGWPLLGIGLGVIIIVIILLVVCICLRSSARKRADDGTTWVDDNTPVILHVVPGYDNLGFASENDAKG